MKRPSIFLIILLVFSISCVRNNQPMATENQTPRESTALFAATGLLAKPDESAAEILLRAHSRDPRAMFLAATGYISGICGFPLDPSLGIGWGAQLMMCGNTPEGVFAAMQIWAIHDDPYLGYGRQLADCQILDGTSYTVLFDQAGIFPFKQICTRVEAAKNRFSNWEKEHWEWVKTVREMLQETEYAMYLMRELNSRPATKAEQADIKKFIRNISVDVLLFFAATSHQAGKLPDWNAKRLASFLENQKKALQKGGKQNLPEFVALVEAVPGVLARERAEPQKGLEKTIAAAHAGDLEDIRAMAKGYAEGSPGFIKDENLSQFWFKYAESVEKLKNPGSETK